MNISSKNIEIVTAKLMGGNVFAMSFMSMIMR